MVRLLDVATQGAIRDRGALVPRNFISIFCKHRSTGAEQLHGVWDDAEAVTVNVVSGETGATVSRNFAGDGAVISMDAIPMRVGLEVRTIQVILSPLNAEVQALLRADDPRFARVEIYRGLLDPLTMLLVAPPRIRFMGKVNGAPIDTPSIGGQAEATLSIVSHTRELTRTSPLKKSDEQQRLRSGDRFRRYVGTAAEWPIWWGEESDRAADKKGR